ncbi:MAG: metallophosphoesterase [Tissierellia bacterium]|nr:metallophosphoesterase [Tissierellia bacterium]
MKVLVLSDSHGDSGIVEEIKKKENPDLAIHLGDYGRDLKDGIAVRGNCDGITNLPFKRLLNLKGHRVFISHGHKENVKMGLHRLFYLAKQEGADIVLYGHTHERLEKEIEGILFLNPGSVARPNWGDRPSYLILNLEEGSVKPSFIEI